MNDRNFNNQLSHTTLKVHSWTLRTNTQSVHSFSNIPSTSLGTMTPPFQVEDVAPSYQLPDFHPINFNLTTRDGSARYQEFCSKFIKRLRERGLHRGWRQWEREVDVFIALLRYNLPRSLRLAQVKIRELQADW